MPLNVFIYMVITSLLISVAVVLAVYLFGNVFEGFFSKIRTAEVTVESKQYFKDRKRRNKQADEHYVVNFKCSDKELIFEVPEGVYEYCEVGQKGILEYRSFEFVSFLKEGDTGMQKTPISLIIDDPAPRVSVYYEHAKDKFTKDGRPLVQEVPNSLLDDFCDIVDKYGLKGKFTVVPMPGGRGYITDPDGIGEFCREEIEEWIDTAIARLGDKFSFCPEMLTHAAAMDIETGKFLDINEFEWSKTQTKETFEPYIAKAMQILTDAGFNICGTSSPWGFGNMVKEEYLPAISEALHKVTGKKCAWVFCETIFGDRPAKPYLAYKKHEFRVVSIPSTIGDGFWETKDTTEDSEEYIRTVADRYISEDGKSGSIIDVLEKGGYPILLTHWQSMNSNGLNTGLKALELVARRVNEQLSDRVEWKSFEEIMNMVTENPEDYPQSAD